MIDQRLISTIRSQFQLDWHGVHGAPHWARVKLNGLTLARETGAREDVVSLFAFLHDSRRVNEWEDPQHGARAAAYARRLVGEVFELDSEGLELLMTACRHHSDGHTTDHDITVLTCWDADRLDLGRVGKYPDPRRLCTEPAQDPDFIERCYLRSIG